MVAYSTWFLLSDHPLSSKQDHYRLTLVIYRELVLLIRLKSLKLRYKLKEKKCLVIKNLFLEPNKTIMHLIEIDIQPLFKFKDIYGTFSLNTWYALNWLMLFQTKSFQREC